MRGLLDKAARTHGDLVIRRRDIIDWYDGIVAGILELDDVSPPYLASLIAWLPGQQTRVFALLPVSMKWVSQVRTVLEQPTGDKHRAELLALVQQARREYRGSVLVVAGKDVDSYIVGWLEIPSEEVEEMRILSVDAEEAINDERLRYWLGRMNVTAT